MNPLPLTYPANPSKPFKANFTPLFWSMAIGLLLPCYAGLPLGLPTRPIAQPLEQQLKASRLPLRCHLQAIAEQSGENRSSLS
ncbi:hypothetical protein [Roseofilum casamattae]|uniref:Uncharacterized protein n=1 Tax=Roseofilum casamattae BLCC-M143 TaxID=3022442 RepID=A0ABT7BT01_9CYAN|nr:hypothetical protein [Roseofilum casamattae]MDJ1182312.1 hypothetical protein [Roseofilum casamattae BLCC-M143]